MIFPLSFIKFFWDNIKMNLLAIFDDFYERKTDIDRLNCGMVTLVPKCVNADKVKDFRPICLLNVSFKILTKVLMHRLESVVSYLIAKNQTAFIKNRYIIDGFMVLHEILNSPHKNDVRNPI
ncbi:hypothetical protein GUJ93_ZPchr0009g556 [Zizania palustris]|uniref:Reverse transcriptase domain-containing protein n=1 Tax=Zizania palustris TaxID=103762 RepID=A0A8J5VMP7_ZIZPA|nr:hypothetical protein GUJ93_ZPchr0009g556 [Zizania palustris]